MSPPGSLSILNCSTKVGIKRNEMLRMVDRLCIGMFILLRGSSRNSIPADSLMGEVVINKSRELKYRISKRNRFIAPSVKPSRVTLSIPSCTSASPGVGSAWKKKQRPNAFYTAECISKSHSGNTDGNEHQEKMKEQVIPTEIN